MQLEQGSWTRILGSWNLADLRFHPVTATIQAVGLLCPLPIIRLEEGLRSISLGEVLELQADDPAVVLDLVAWCNSMKQELLAIFIDHHKVYHGFIRKQSMDNTG